MTELPDASRAALAPVRAYLSAAAQAKAAQSSISAQERAKAATDEAEAESARIRSAAAAEGEAAATSAAALVSARARRRARETVLERQNAIRLDLRQRVVASAKALTADPRYPKLVERLTARAHELLGPDAEVSESPDGGVLAAAGSRSLDLSLPTLAGRTLDSLTEEIRALWTP